MTVRKRRWSVVLLASSMLALFSSCTDEAKEPLVYSTIHEAAAKGNLADVKRHLARGEAVNAKDNCERTPLHMAASRGCMEVAEYLIGKGADVNAKDNDEATPLHMATEAGHKGVVEFLRSHGATDISATRSEALALWNQGARELGESKAYDDALRTFEKLATDPRYRDTELGKRAASVGVPNVKNAIVAREFAMAEAKFKDRARDTVEAIKAIRDVAKQLKARFPGYAVVEDQEKVRIANIQTRHDRAAIGDWNVAVHSKIQDLCGRMQYGKALAEAQTFAEKWPGAKKASEAVSSGVIQINQFAEKKFEEVEKRVKLLQSENKKLEAEDLLGKVIRNFGIPKYEQKAQELLKGL